MTKAHSRSSPPSRKRDRPQSTGAFWFLLGVLVGAFGVGLAWMNQARIPEQPAQPQADRAPHPKPTFDFFESLPQEEVLVPIEGVGANSSAPPSKPASPATKTASPKPESQPTAAQRPPPSAGTYRLQVGSFRDAADAERRKAELALLGVRVDIEEAEVDGASTYRLRTGQLDKAAADALGHQLQAQGVSSMAIKAN